MKTKNFAQICILLLGLTLFSACRNDVPSVVTLGAEMIAHETECEIVVGGQITSDGGDLVFAYGVCLSEHANPTIQDTKRESKGSISTGAFSSTFSNLSGDRTYYVRAYATNIEGVGYGEIIEIETSYKVMPKILAIKSDSITLEEATISSRINPQGEKTDVFILFGTSANSLNQEINLGTYQDNQEIDLSYELKNLASMTHYYYCFKAKSDNGVILSEVGTFETYAAKDRDGNMYRAVQIGDQIIITENLKTTRFLNGDLIPEVKDQGEWSSMKTPARCYYDNNPANGETYGFLYNWYVASDPRGLIEGWHVLTYPETEKMANYLGGQTPAGGKMKAVSSFWQEPNVGATNESGFTSLPGGFRKDNFRNINFGATYWNSDSFPLGGMGSMFYITFNYSTIYYAGNYYYTGSSIRLIKN